MKHLSAVVMFGLVLTSSPARAVDFVLDGGLHFGGDTLVIVIDDRDKTREVKAGQLASAALGVRFDLSESLEMPVTLGYKTDFASTDTNNDQNTIDVRFDRFPINALLLYKADLWRFGAGLTYHLNPKLTIKGDGYNESYKFKDALGYLAELRFYFSDNAYVGGRYTKIEYELEYSSYKYKFDGSSIGVVLGANL